ncbi:MAG: two-component system copper resistance phosphate regulon response regulator CusR [Bacteroidia bacterium]|jgi:two-component system copper resistance phosphate regulon response regulator CusR
MKILLIEDEQSVSSFIKRGLEEQGNHAVQAFDGTSGLRLSNQDDFDLIILDIVMPGMNGIEVCDTLKNKREVDTPILMLTALGTTDDIVIGLETGADDYLAKPFKFKELLARINALARRGSVIGAGGASILKVQDLEMNVKSKEVYRNGKEITLTAREFRLLEYLLKNKNRVVSRTDILENVWEVDFDLGTNVIDVYINYLRNKIEHNFQSKIIKTVIGMGYMIKEQ